MNWVSGHIVSLNALLVLLVAASGSAVAGDRIEQQIAEFLSLAVIENGRHEEGELARWMSPLKLSVEGHDLNPVIVEMADTIFRKFALNTGLELSRAVPATANIRVRYLNYLEMVGLLKSGTLSIALQEHLERWLQYKRSPCTYATTRRHGAIESADIFIKADESDWIVADWCIKSKGLRVLGFVNSVEVEGSVLTPPPRGSWDMTDKDWEYLKVLYSDQLHAGMSRAEAEEVVRKLLPGADSNN